MTNKITHLKSLKGKCLKCHKCTIGSHLINNLDPHVFSFGNVNSDIMFIGMNPAMEEMKQKVPLVGRSGKYYESMLEHVGLQRKHVYTTNILKCATMKDNKVRTPEQEEVDNCSYIIEDELRTIKPKLIVTFGALPLMELTGLSGVTSLCGDAIYSRQLQTHVFVLLHPSAVFRNPKKNAPIMKSGVRKLKQYIIDQKLNERYM